MHRPWLYIIYDRQTANIHINIAIKEFLDINIQTAPVAIRIASGIHFLWDNLYLPDLSLHQNAEQDPAELFSELRMTYHSFKQKIINQVQIFKCTSCHSASFLLSHA